MFRRAVLIITFFVLFLLCSLPLSAEEIVFTNGDRLTASILNDSKERITIYSQAIGTVTVDRIFIASPVYDKTKPTVQDEEKKKKEWTGKAALGLNRSGGNTVRKEANASMDFQRKTKHNETNFRVSSYYSSYDNQMNAQRYYGLARHAFSLGDLKWYNFYKMEFNHDYFANIDYRLIPSTGLGYWFFDDPQLKLLFETAVGFEYTSYRNQDSESNFILLPRGYFKKRLFPSFWVEQNLTFYLVVDDLNRFRLRSESSLIHELTEKISWRLSLIDEYDADPADGAKENDYRIIYAIEYSF